MTEISDFIIRAYMKFMFKYPTILQNESILDLIGMKQSKHQSLMEKFKHENTYNINKCILKELDDKFVFCGRDKLYLMILEMNEYGMRLDDISKVIGCDENKINILFNEFNSIISNYKDIIYSSDKIRYLSCNK